MTERRREERAGLGARLGRGGLPVAVLGCALAAGVMLASSGVGWLKVTLAVAPPLPDVQQTLTGAEIAEPLVPIGLLVGAAGLALIATGRVGRLAVGWVLVAAGLLVAAAVGFFLYDGGSLQALNWAQDRAAGESLFPQRNVLPAPPAFALLGSAVAIAVGLFTLRCHRQWPVMGSRYERRTASDDPAIGSSPAGSPAHSQARPAASEAAMWNALERGEDPTVSWSTAQPPEALDSTPDQSGAGR